MLTPKFAGLRQNGGYSMNKLIRMGLKYLLIAIATTAIYRVISYCTKSVVDIKELVIFAFVLFVIYCVMTLISPSLRKLLGYDKK